MQIEPNKKPIEEQAPGPSPLRDQPSFLPKQVNDRGWCNLVLERVDSPGAIRPKKEYRKPCETCFVYTLSLNDEGPSMK